MVINNKPVIEIIKQRYSCRIFQKRPIDALKQEAMRDLLATIKEGPFANRLRFNLVTTASVGMVGQTDRHALRGLGTYGTLRNVPGFIAGAVAALAKKTSNTNIMEDYGYCLEEAILHAKSLGLDTYWLGGFFTRSSFARAVHLTPEEIMPAVAAIGYALNEPRSGDIFRATAGSNRRFPWDKLFFQNDSTQPILPDDAGAYADPLEMVRLAPSASNKQPWRILKQGNKWHFYLRRTPGYGSGFVSLFLGHTDLQRVDMGIAMCHFQLTANELGLKGGWELQEPAITPLDDLTEYIITWIST